MKEIYSRSNAPDMAVPENPYYTSYRIKPNKHPSFEQGTKWLIFIIKFSKAKFYYAPIEKVCLNSNYEMVDISELTALIPTA